MKLHTTPPNPNSLSQSRQLVVVLAESWKTVNAQLQTYERVSATSPWIPVGGKVDVALGENGLGWAQGTVLHHLETSPVKSEGDGKSPAGIFRLTAVFGYEDKDSLLKMPYINISDDVECIDDVNSSLYNTIVDRKRVSQVDWTSSEKMHRPDDLYRFGIVVDFNRDPVIPGSGSCIFLHIWRGHSSPTAGCTAFSEQDMIRILRWIDASANPILVQLPIEEYDRHQSAMDLPRF